LGLIDLPSNCQFRGNRQREDRTLVMGVTGIVLTCQPRYRTVFRKCTVGVPRDGERVALRYSVVVPVKTLGIFNSFPRKIEIQRRNNPITSLDRPWVFQEVEASRFQDNRHMKVVRLSALAPAAF